MPNLDWEKILAVQREMDKFYEKNANAMICKSRQIGFSYWHRARLQRMAFLNGEEVEIPAILLGGKDVNS